MRINAATMLGQGKNAYQAEIDAACETIDYLRYNVYFASQIYAEQPRSTLDQLNRMEYRPLEGFVFTVSPFNFTAIASNLNLSVALMGNTTVWKPASTALLSNYYLMQAVHGGRAAAGRGQLRARRGLGRRAASALAHRDARRHPLHRLERHLQRASGRPWPRTCRSYRSYPRIVGETGGKDFIFAHASADPPAVATAMVRGAFEYQGQKCSAASRAYVPRSLWPDDPRRASAAMLGRVKVGDVRDFGNFVNAVIDEASFDNIMGYIEQARRPRPTRAILFGGEGDKSTGYFVQPTVIEIDGPALRHHGGGDLRAGAHGLRLRRRQVRRDAAGCATRPRPTR